MKTIASLVQINAGSSSVALREQQSALYDAIAELESAAEQIDAILAKREASALLDAAVLAIAAGQAPDLSELNRWHDDTLRGLRSVDDLARELRAKNEARDYSASASFAARDMEAVSCYRDIRGACCAI